MEDTYTLPTTGVYTKNSTPTKNPYRACVRFGGLWGGMPLNVRFYPQLVHTCG